MKIRNIKYIEKFGIDSLHSLNKLNSTNNIISIPNNENINPNIQHSNIISEQTDDWDFYVYLDIEETHKNIKNIQIYQDQEYDNDFLVNNTKFTQTSPYPSSKNNESLFCIFSNIGKNLIEKNKSSTSSDYIPVFNFLCFSSIFYITSQLLSLSKNYTD